MSSAPDEVLSPIQNNGVTDLARQPSRVSGRVRTNVNYTTLAAGTGEISANFDYGEINGAANAGGKNLALKKKAAGLKLNTDVLKKCTEFWKRLRDSS